MALGNSLIGIMRVGICLVKDSSLSFGDGIGVPEYLVENWRFERSQNLLWGQNLFKLPSLVRV